MAGEDIWTVILVCGFPHIVFGPQTIVLKKKPGARFLRIFTEAFDRLF